MSTPAQVYEVVISHINDPHDFYVRLETCHQELEAIDLALNEIDTKDSSPSEVDFLNKNLLWAYSDPKYGLCRVLINNQNDTSCDVYYIDYGKRRNVSKDSLRVIRHSYCLKVPPLAIHCKLDWCTPIEKEWTENDVDVMKQLTHGIPLRMIVKRVLKNRKSLVELYGVDCIATMLAYCGNALFNNPQNEINQISEFKKFEPKVFEFFKPNDNQTMLVNVCHYKDIHDFYLIEVKFVDILGKIHELLNRDFEHYERLPQAAIKKDLPVACELNRKGQSYHRALVVDVPSNKRKARVLLVDDGVTRDVDVGSLRRPNDSFFEHSPLAMNCSLDASQEMQYKVTQKFHIGAQMVVEVVKAAREFSGKHLVTVSLKHLKNKDLKKFLQ